MPIEIRELIIRVAVDENRNKPKGNLMGPKELADLKSKIIRECTENIMQRINKLSDR